GILPPNLKVEKERHLKVLEGEFLKKRTDTEEIKMRKKYRLVKFLELKKVMKEMNKLTRLKKEETDLTEAEIAAIEEQLHQLDVDYHYINHFPVGRKYISLYPKIESKDPDNDKKRQEIREQIWKSVESECIHKLRDQYRAELEKEVAVKLEAKTSKKKMCENSDAGEDIVRDDFFEI
ncbi:545_t:CDS:2, partial [Ambispora gerdemannii]